VSTVMVDEVRGGGALSLSRTLLASCVAIALVDCGSVATTPETQTASPPVVATTAPSPSPAPAATAPRSARATWTTAAGTSDIVSHLRAAGLTTNTRDVPPGAASLTLFGAEKTELLSVENENLTLFSFMTADQAESVFQLVSQRRETVSWEATPYFVKVGSTLAVLTTMNEAAARRVVDALIR
jgi:hypothetical protein